MSEIQDTRNALHQALMTGDHIQIAAVLFPRRVNRGDPMRPRTAPPARPSPLSLVERPEHYDPTPIAVHLLRHMADGLERGWAVPAEEWQALLNFLRVVRPELFTEQE